VKNKIPAGGPTPCPANREETKIVFVPQRGREMAGGSNIDPANTAE